MDVRQEDIGKIRDKVDGLEGSMKNFESTVDDLKTKTNKLDVKVDKLEKSVEGLDSKVTNLEKSVGDLNVKVGKLETNMSNLSQQMTNLAQTMNKNTIDLTKKFDVLEEKMNGSETRIVNKLWPMVVGVVVGSVTIGVTVLGFIGNNSKNQTFILPPPSYYQMPPENRPSISSQQAIPPQTEKINPAKADSSQN